MAEPRVGYYVHHQGAGHATRALAIARRMDSPVTLIGSTLPAQLPAPIQRLDLPGDTAPGMRVERFDSLHYAPLGVDGLRERMGLLGDWMRAAWPCLLVVDVSVEIALLARLFGVPTLYLRQHGRRDDAAHRQAYACAAALLAPFPRAMESEDTPPEVLGKTRYAGWVSRYAGAAPGATQPGRVLVINGHGGTAFSHAGLAELANACPQRRLYVAGAVEGAPTHSADNLTYLGMLDDPQDEMRRAELVIGSAGDSLVAEAASLGCRYIAIAEDRPFDEQRAQARRLQQLGVAVGLEAWPDASQWPALLTRASQLDPRTWRAWADEQAGARCAAIIEEVLAQSFRSPCGPR
jgi:predicted glycosyltransferase